MTPTQQTQKTSQLRSVKKRDGRVVSFDSEKITHAIEKAFESQEFRVPEVTLSKLTDDVLALVDEKYDGTIIPTVEQVQDIVETVLIVNKYAKVAKAYILYRSERAKLRDKREVISDETKKLIIESKKYFSNQLAEFVFYRTYARWIPQANRRETWIETVGRYMDFMMENLGTKLTDKEYEEVRQAILKQEAMPSMRLLQFAGKPARKTNVCAYNCSFIAPSKLEDFSEIMYILMCGTGVGFSVEHHNVEALPQIMVQTGQKLPTHVVADSKEGWADAFKLGLKTWYSGKDIDFDYSKVRPVGSRLGTMGGRASGPEPLKQLLEFSRERVLARQGRRLKTIDVHDVICKTGEVVVAGGTRRSALISLSDLDDTDLREAKMGAFFTHSPHRSMSNNSTAYKSKPSLTDFMDEWISLMKSGTGERGIFNRAGLVSHLPQRRVEALGEAIQTTGTNPCGEIILQSKQFCNLTEVVARSDDDEKSLMRKLRIATILGSYQATLTNFPYLSKEWKDHCETERLLGVSITGQWDCPAVRNEKVLLKMKEEAVRLNKEFSKRFGINQSTCITCVKPSGTVSQTVDAASGIHPRYAPYYIRRVRISGTDPLFHMLRDQKVPFYPEVGQTIENATTFVLEFPVKAPKNAVFKDDISALDQLEYWKKVKMNFTEHNPSITVYVGEEEWLQVGNWVYANWDIIGGISFLPRSNHVYKLAPYEEITKDDFDRLTKEMPIIDFADMMLYEKEDATEAKAELACAGGTCEIQ
ncbi:MAG TPA: ATP cone domain-containing protein [Candidatus Nanoarchaeia archaeon]|nr:ATP cone domain-containing protein [Candidatus Nanoarchaeia archaeon]